jgi:hydroxymethylbilane synthase
MSQKIWIGTRGSRLALVQTTWIRERLLSLHPGMEIEIREIRTTGDRIQDVPLAAIGDKGLFTRELDDAMRSGEIDLAVHSLKDLPSVLEAGIGLGAVPAREDVADAWVSRRYANLDEVPAGARVLTGSLRRGALLQGLRPDLRVEDLRGNVPTRLEKIKAEGIAGGVLAMAGLKRLGLGDEIRARLDPARFVPAVGQGALAVTARSDDARMAALLVPLEDTTARRAVTAERAFLARLEGGCQVPMGCYARVDGDHLALVGLVASLDGARIIRRTLTGATGQAEALGLALAEEILSAGGDVIIHSLH